MLLMEVETEKRLAKNTTKRKGDSRGDVLIAIGQLSFRTCILLIFLRQLFPVPGKEAKTCFPVKAAITIPK